MLNQKKRHHAIYTLLFLLVIDAINFGLLLPILPALFAKGGVFIAHIKAHTARLLTSLALGIYPLTVCIATPLIGSCSDRFGRKNTLRLTLSTCCIGLFLSIIALIKANLLLFVIGRALNGLASASQSIAQASIADLSDEKERAFYFNFISVALTAGMVLGPLLGAFLSDPHICAKFNITTPFIAALCLALCNLFLLTKYYKKDSLKIKTQRSIKQYLTACCQYFKIFNFLQLILIFILSELSWSLFFQGFPLQLRLLHHFSAEKQSLYMTYLGLLMCFALLTFFKPLYRQFSLHRILQLCLITNAFAFLSLTFAPFSDLLWISPFFFCAGIGIAYTAVSTGLSLIVSPQHQGWLMGFFSALLALTWALSALYVPFLLQTPLKGLEIISILTLIAMLLAFVPTKPQVNLRNSFTHLSAEERKSSSFPSTSFND